MDKFYMVYVEGNRAPRIKHEEYENAKAEAYRLAQLECKQAYVLQAIVALVPEFTEVELGYPSKIQSAVQERKE